MKKNKNWQEYQKAYMYSSTAKEWYILYMHIMT